MGRLAQANVDVRALVSKAEQGDPLAALELAQLYKVQSVTELVGVVCPLVPPTVEAFNACADAVALKRELEARKRPVLGLH